MWKAQAPSNIALIKYMGKSEGNRPANASLSYTLNHFVTEVQIAEANADGWEPLEKKGFYVRLSPTGQERFLKFFKELKARFEIGGNFLIRSANNFPSDCGLASSASSFAALTKAAYAIAKDQRKMSLSEQQLSGISRTGSGSSCRSFFSPWAIWQNEFAEAIDLPFKNLIHQVVVVEEKEKLVSSSKAHARVVSSSLYLHRTARAQERLNQLISCLRERDWRKGFEVTWAEFWDMHALFETSQPPFGYMSEGSMIALNVAREMWEQEKDGPLVTMDAGPNVHLLYRSDQSELAQKYREWIEETDSSTRVIGNDVETI